MLTFTELHAREQELRKSGYKEEFVDGYLQGHQAGYYEAMYYANQHDTYHSKAYYVFRGFVRGLFWTAVITSFTAIAVASIWVLWAVL